jgi:hypothetical protein
MHVVVTCPILVGPLNEQCRTYRTRPPCCDNAGPGRLGLLFGSEIVSVLVTMARSTMHSVA